MPNVAAGGTGSTANTPTHSVAEPALDRAQVPGKATAPAPIPLTVVLMGDSYTSGNGARTSAGDPAYYGPARCLQSTQTWGEQYASTLNTRGYAVALLNRACSAATTDSVTHSRYLKRTDVLRVAQPEPAGTYLPDSVYTDWASRQPQCTPAPASAEFVVTAVNRTTRADGGRDITVSCAHWLRPQVDALSPDVDLVLLTVGGNDVHFPDIVRNCLILGNEAACAQDLATADAYVANEFTADLVAMFDEIHNRTDGNARVVYLAYPHLEVNDQLMLTGLGARGGSSDIAGMVTLPLGQRLGELGDAGLAAQREAVAQLNARYGDGWITLLDGVPDLFAGHEPDARPATANPKRWMYEAFETWNRDEWYHLKPEGHRQIAQYVASFGDFGAARADDATASRVRDQSPASPPRDLAIVVDQQSASAQAVVAQLRDGALFTGARITLIEQRIAADGVGVDRRVIVTGVGAASAADVARQVWADRWEAEAGLGDDAAGAGLGDDAVGAGLGDDAVGAGLGDDAVGAGLGANATIEAGGDAPGAVDTDSAAAPATAPATAPALATATPGPWLPASKLSIDARWNASAQVIYVGDASLALSTQAPVWSGVANGRPVDIDIRTVDIVPGSSASAADANSRLGRALAEASATPHAWAGGPYVADGQALVLTARGSYAALADSDSPSRPALTYEWDLDGDGFFEVTADGPDLVVPADAALSGWVRVRVSTADGAAAIASAWVSSSNNVIPADAACAPPAPVGGSVSTDNAAPAPVGGPVTAADAPPAPVGGPVNTADAAPAPIGGPVTAADAAPGPVGVTECIVGESASSTPDADPTGQLTPTPHQLGVALPDSAPVSRDLAVGLSLIPPLFDERITGLYGGRLRAPVHTRAHTPSRTPARVSSGAASRAASPARAGIGRYLSSRAARAGEPTPATQPMRTNEFVRAN